MCIAAINQHTYSGTMINDLVAVCDSVDSSDGYEVLRSARKHIEAHDLDVGDINAWILMRDCQDRIVQGELVRLKVSRQCEASIGGGENPPQCYKPAIADGHFCETHAEEEW